MAIREEWTGFLRLGEARRSLTIDPTQLPARSAQEVKDFSPTKRQLTAVLGESLHQERRIMFEETNPLRNVVMTLAAAMALCRCQRRLWVLENAEEHEDIQKVKTMMGAMRLHFGGEGVQFDESGDPVLSRIYLGEEGVDLENLEELPGQCFREAYEALARAELFVSTDIGVVSETPMTLDVMELDKKVAIANAVGESYVTIDPKSKELVPTVVRHFYCHAGTGEVLRPVE